MRQIVFKALVWEGTGIFVILLSQDAVKSRRPEPKFQTIIS